MHGKTRVTVMLIAVIALAGLASGGSILADRVVFAEPNDPPSSSDTFVGCGGFGVGGMMGGLGGMMGGGMFLDRVTLDKVSKLTGVPSQDILTQLRQGKSLVEISQGKADENKLVDILLAFPRDAMKLRVQHGYLTEQQAEQALQQMEQAAKDFVNNKWQGTPSLGPRGGSGVGPGPRSGTGIMGGGSKGGMMGGYGSNGSYGGMMSGYRWQ